MDSNYSNPPASEQVQNSRPKLWLKARMTNYAGLCGKRWFDAKTNRNHEFRLSPDTENNTCVPCEANCASCQDRPDHCTSCEHHLVMHENRCYAACPVFTYETQDYNCAPCHSTCETCNGTSDNQCIGCRSGLFSHNGTLTWIMHLVIFRHHSAVLIGV